MYEEAFVAPSVGGGVRGREARVYRVDVEAFAALPARGEGTHV